VLHRDRRVLQNNYIRLCCWLCLLLFFSTTPVWSQDKEESSITGIFDFYQTVISPIDGDRCPMYPSCSQYAKHSIEKHGPILGWIMSMDRLVRCGRDEKEISPALYMGDKKYIYDPVENNDFWWSDK
jgi:uncharacterized protein